MTMFSLANKDAYKMGKALQRLGFCNNDAQYIVLKCHCQSARNLFFMFDDEIEALEFAMLEKHEDFSKEQFKQQIYYLKLACVWVREKFCRGFYPIDLDEISIDVLSKYAGVHHVTNPINHHNPSLLNLNCGSMTGSQILWKVGQLISNTFGVLQIPLDYLLHRDFFHEPTLCDDFSDEMIIYHPEMLTKFNINVMEDDRFITAFHYDNAELWRLIASVISPTKFYYCIINTINFRLNGIVLFQELQEAVGEDMHDDQDIKSEKARYAMSRESVSNFYDFQWCDEVLPLLQLFPDNNSHFSIL